MFITDLPFHEQPEGPISIAAIGCGARAQTYLAIARDEMPQRYTVVAGADPVGERRARIRQISQNPTFCEFEDAEALLQQPRLADVLLISTQDNYHFDPCQKAIEKGYHVLLEKPIAQTADETAEIARLARLHDRRVVICFVLRYTTFYQKLKEILDAGRIGEIVSVNCVEGVEPWHQAHSFVRGHWARKDPSTPMIVAKGCHQMDILAWLLDDRCQALSSMGKLTYFTLANKPDRATLRCTDGCPHVGECVFDAHRYAGEMRDPWLRVLLPNWREMSDEAVYRWLETSNWGRCVWQCDNDVVDHQVISLQFNKGVTATFTMTAFESHTHMEFFGTRGVLKAGTKKRDELGCDIWIRDHGDSAVERVSVDKSAPVSEHDMHGGGDWGLVNAMDRIFRGAPGTETDLIETAVEGHLMAFAAEASRVNGGQCVDLADYRDKLG